MQDGKTALDLAKEKDHTAVVDLLEGLANGACVLLRGVVRAAFGNECVVIV